MKADKADANPNYFSLGKTPCWSQIATTIFSSLMSKPKLPLVPQIYLQYTNKHITSRFLRKNHSDATAMRNLESVWVVWTYAF